jgi:hypothetical protein
VYWGEGGGERTGGLALPHPLGGWTPLLLSLNRLIVAFINAIERSVNRLSNSAKHLSRTAKYSSRNVDDVTFEIAAYRYPG